MQAWRDREALFSQRDGRFEQLCPRQAAVFLVGQFQRAQHPRSTDRAPANLRLREWHRFTVSLQEEFFVGAGRCGFAAVVGAHGLAIPQHDQRTATDPRGLRLYQRQHRLHGNRRVDGRATLAQHLTPGCGGQRVGGRGHVFAGVLSLQVGAIPRRHLGRGGQGADRWGVAGGEGQGAGDERQGAEAIAAQGEGWKHVGTPSVG
ncbi:hypothetical protein D3C78_886360 [compost metagenome]